MSKLVVQQYSSSRGPGSGGASFITARDGVTFFSVDEDGRTSRPRGQVARPPLTCWIVSTRDAGCLLVVAQSISIYSAAKEMLYTIYLL